MPEEKQKNNGKLEWTVRSLMNEEYIHRLIAEPREIPRRIREEIAEIIIREIIDDKPEEIKDLRKFMERYGAFYSIFATIKNLDSWKEIKEIACQNRIAAMRVIEVVLRQIFDMIAGFSKYKKELDEEVDKDLKELLEEFAKLIEETMNLWGRRTGAIPEGTDIYIQFENFHKTKKSGKMLNRISQITFTDQISDDIQKIKDELEAMELLYLLFPGRLWDYSLMDLHRIYLQNISRYSRILEKNREIKKMIDLLGRIELEYGSKRLAITNFGSSEIYSIGISKDIQHILPIELVKLENETLKNLFFANFSEGKLLTYQLRGKYWVGGTPKEKKRGPVVALVDTSGSMHGEPELLAKAMILSIVRIMLKKEREVKVILFSSIDQTYEIELTNKTKMSNEFLSFINCSFGGGTDFNTALKAGVKSLEEKKWEGADILFLTDGLSEVTDQALLSKWNDVKGKNDARIFTIIFGNDTAGGIEKISEHVYIFANCEDWNISDSPSNMIKLISGTSTT